MSKKQEKIFAIRSRADLNRAVSALIKIEPTEEHSYMLRITLEEESRSNKQNRLSFLWYNQLGKLTGHGTDHERRRCKLHFGIPILRADDEGFNSYCLTTIDRMPYEMQMLTMEYMDVTSLMSVGQFAEYLTTIDRDAAQQGHVLPHPDDLYYEALMKER